MNGGQASKQSPVPEGSAQSNQVDEIQETAYQSQAAEVTTSEQALQNVAAANKYVTNDCSSYFKEILIEIGFVEEITT